VCVEDTTAGWTAPHAATTTLLADLLTNEGVRVEPDTAGVAVQLLYSQFTTNSAAAGGAVIVTNTQGGLQVGSELRVQGSGFRMVHWQFERRHSGGVHHDYRCAHQRCHRSQPPSISSMPIIIFCLSESDVRQNMNGLQPVHADHRRRDQA
jgi:hypothetical protein